MEELYRVRDFGNRLGCSENEKGTPVRLAESWRNRTNRLTEVEKVKSSRSGGSFASSALTLDPVRTFQSSNQPPEPTSTSVTAAADAPAAPLALAAHL